MPNALTIDKATVHQARAIANVHSQSWQSAYRGLMSDHYLDVELLDIKHQHWLGVLRDIPEGAIILLARKRELIVGFIAVYANHHPDYDYYIDNIHVLPSEKGQGIGKFLMSSAANQITTPESNSIALTVFQQNKDAIEFYKKLGGKIVAEGADVFGGERVPDYLMAWDTAKGLSTLLL